MIAVLVALGAVFIGCAAVIIWALYRRCRTKRVEPPERVRLPVAEKCEWVTIDLR